MSESILQKTFRTIGRFSEELEKLTRADLKKPEEQKNQGPEILTADKLRNLKWMTARQLAVIYGYGKRQVKLADDKEAYRQLMWFDEAQLKAIFGKDPEEDD